MGEVVAFVMIMIVATLAFEAAWRIAVALLVLGPAAYAAIVAGWVATHFQSGPFLAVTLALGTGLGARWLMIAVVKQGIYWTASSWTSVVGRHT